MKITIPVLSNVPGGMNFFDVIGDGLPGKFLLLYFKSKAGVQIMLPDMVSLPDHFQCTRHLLWREG